MPSTDLVPDLNATITAAVNARVEAATLAALSDSDTFQALVVSAMQQHVEVSNGTYSKEKVPFINAILRRMIQDRTKEIVALEIEGQAEAIRTEVRKALRQSIGVVADSLVDGFVASASGRHPSITVTFGSDV